MRRFLWLSLSVFACTSPDDEVDPPTSGCPAVADPALADLFATLDAERKDLGAPGRAVAVLIDGEIAGCAGFGTASDGGPAIDAHTGFRIGSQTKSLTAAGLLKLVDQGEITLDTPMSQVFDGWDMEAAPGAGDLLTPRLMMSHQGGFVDYLAIDDRLPLLRFVTEEIPANLYLMAPPGSFYNYANPNFYVVGAIIEQVTGTKYTTWMEDEVFAPLGMDETVFDAAELPDHTFATGLGADWETGDLGLVDQTPTAYDNPWARPAGYAWSTANDLALLGQAVLNGTDLLSTASQEAWTSPQVDTHEIGAASHYGFGWSINDGHFDGGDDWWDQRLVLHGGDIPGFATDFILAPDDGFGIIVLTSIDGGHVGAQAQLDALRAFAPRDPSPAPDVMFSPDRLEHYAGTYQDPWNVGEMVFTVDGDALSLSMPALDALGVPYEAELAPYLADSFVMNVQDTPLVLTFLDGDDGAAKWARTRAFVGERVSE